MRLRYLWNAVLWVPLCLVGLLLSGEVFAIPSGRTGVFFSGQSASFVVKDQNTTINVRSTPQKSWEGFSIIRDCGDPVTTGERDLTNLDCWGCCELVVENSNAIVNNSNAIHNNWDLTVSNSTWIANYEECCDNWSQLIVDNSNSNVVNWELTVNNSTWIVNHTGHDTDCCENWTQLIVDNSNSNVINWDLTVNNSTWIVNHTGHDSDCCENWTQLIVDNSNSNVVNWDLTVNNSTWIVNHTGHDTDCCENWTQLIVDNSNSNVINWDLTVNNSTWINNYEDCCDNWSQLIVDNSNSNVINWSLTINNSDWIAGYSDCCDLVVQNSVAINNLDNRVTVNKTNITSNALNIISNYNQIVNHSNAIKNNWNLTVANSNSNVINWDLAVDNSIWINNYEDCCDNWSQLIIDNSNSNVVNWELTVNNSDWIAGYSDCCDLVVQNSVAINNLDNRVTINKTNISTNAINILANYNQIINHSNAIKNNWNLVVDNSIWINNYEDCCDNWSQLIIDNSNSNVVNWELTVNNSTWIVNHTGHDTDCCENWTQLIVDNSNSNVINWDLTVNNSIWINNYEDCCDNWSQLIIDNSNSNVVNWELTVNNSDWIVTHTDLFGDCCESWSQLIIDNSNSNVINWELTVNNSTWIVNHTGHDTDCCENWTQLIVDNSNSNVVNWDLTVNNSVWINNYEDCCDNWSQLIIDNSNSNVVNWDLTVNNSIWINNYEDCCDNWSQLIIDNSNSNVVNWELTVNNSDWIVNHTDLFGDCCESWSQLIIDNSNSNVVNWDLTVNNSIWINNYEDCCDNWSQLIIDNSNSNVVNWELTVNNSTWIVNHTGHDTDCCENWTQLIVDNSNSNVVNWDLTVNNSVWINNYEDCCDNWSQLIIDNSNSNVVNWELTVNNSDWIVNHTDLFGDCCESWSQLIIDNSNSNVVNWDLTVNNSIWINNYEDCCDNWSQLIIDNSNSNVVNWELTVNNSTWIVNHTGHDTECCENWTQLIIDNSNSNVVNWDLTVNNSIWINNFEDCCDNWSQLIIDNSNSNVVNWELTVNNSDWIVTHTDIFGDCCESWSQLIIDNSNSNVVNWDLTVNNSIWINNYEDCCDNWSQLIIDNSNSNVINWELTVNNSTWIVNHTGHDTECCENWTQLIIDNSNSNVINWDLTVNNSIWINNYEDCCDNWSQLIIDNSNSNVINWELTVNNSDWIVNYSDCCLNWTWTQLIIENSNAIVKCCPCECECECECEGGCEGECECPEECGGTCGCEQELIGGPISDDLYLHKSCHLHPCQKIDIVDDVTITGSGVMLVFSPNRDCCQFRVAPGKTVTLKDIDLKHISARTFCMGDCSKIKIAGGVMFELSENLTFSTGSIEIIDDNGAPNVFTVRGIGGIKRFGLDTTGCCQKHLSYERDTYREFDPELALDLNHHTLYLQDIELVGVADINSTTEVIGESFYRGSIGLGGGVIVNVEVNNDLGYVIDGVDNEIRVVTDDIRFDGSMLFANRSDNVVNFNFAIPERLGQPPIVQFNNNFLLVQSDAGRSGIIFDDNEVTINNLGPNSFVVGDRSFLGGNFVEILNNPILQKSNDFDMGLHLVLRSNQDNAIEYGTPFYFRSPFFEGLPKVTSALHLRQVGEENRLAQVINPERLCRAIPNELFAELNLDLLNSAEPEAIECLNEVFAPKDVEIADDCDADLRAVSLPTDVNIVYNNVAKVTEAEGNIIVKYGKLTDFGIHTVNPLNLVLQGDAVVEQAEAPTILKSGDIINVVGKRNRILVKNTLTINGDLLFDTDAELEIVFDENAVNPQVIFADSTDLVLEAGCRLAFVGRGTVVLGDLMTVDCKGTGDANRPELAFDLAEVQVPGVSLIFGIGRVEADHGARVHVYGDGHLIFGNTSSDDLDILFDRLAVLHIANATGKVSINAGTASVIFDRSASLLIDDDAELELNVYNGAISAGIITQFIFRNDARLKLGAEGKLSIADNSDASEIEWLQTDGRVRSVGDGGIVTHVVTPVPTTSFAGRMPDQATLEKSTLKLGATSSVAEIVQAFLQRDPDGLNVTTVFFDESGNRWVRKGDGTMIAVTAGDVVTEDGSGNTYINGFLV